MPDLAEMTPPRAGNTPPSTPVTRAFLEIRQLLRSILSRMVSNPDDVEDLLQDTYLKATAGERTTVVSNPKGYLVTVARSLALTELSRRSKQIFESIEGARALEVISDEATGEEKLIGRQKLEIFASAVATLPPQCRRAFLLCKVFGLSYKEIAKEMGISVSTVEKHMIVALKRCGAKLRAADEGRPETGGAEPTPLRSSDGAKAQKR